MGGKTLEERGLKFCLQVGKGVFVEGVVCGLAEAANDFLAAEAIKKAGHCEDFIIDYKIY